MDTYEEGRIKEMTQNCKSTTLERSFLVVLTKQCQNLAIGQHS